MTNRSPMLLCTALAGAALLATGCGSMADAWEDVRSPEPTIRTGTRVPTLPAPDVPPPSEVIAPAEPVKVPEVSATSVMPERAEPVKKVERAETVERPVPAAEATAPEPELPARVDMSASGERKSISYLAWKAGEKPRAMPGEAEPEAPETYVYDPAPGTETVVYGDDLKRAAAQNAAALASPALANVRPEALEGEWRAETGGMRLTLKRGGAASSTGLPDLSARSWSLKAGVLTLTGEDASSGWTIPFALEFDVIEADAASLVLRQGARVMRFKR